MNYYVSSDVIKKFKQIERKRRIKRTLDGLKILAVVLIIGISIKLFL